MTQATIDKHDQRFKAPPISLDAEEAILSVLINDRTGMEILTEMGVDKSYFQSVMNKNLYSAIKCLVDDGKGLDIVSVKAFLQKKHHGNEAIINKLVSLLEMDIPTFNLNTHIEELVENKERIKCFNEGMRLVEESYSQNGRFKFSRNFLKTLTARDIMKMEFKEQRWIVENIIPEGLSILCGRPKLGKSRLALDLAVSIALGVEAFGKIAVEKTGVLYLALEDTPRRLNQRLGLLLQGVEAPDNLHLLTEFRKMKDGGLEILDKWLKQNKETKFIIIDTFAKLKGRGSKSNNIYLDDYECISKIKTLADENNMAILLVHHTKKAPTEDFLDSVSGTTGITGAVDTVLVLKRDRNSAEAILQTTGRDIEERELAFVSNDETLGWTLLGDSQEYNMTEERRQVFEFVREAKKPVRTKDIAEALKKTPNSVTRLLTKLAEDNFIKQSDGGYILSSL